MKTVMCYTAGQTTKGAVAIRKPAGAGNGYRVCWVGAFKNAKAPCRHYVATRGRKKGRRCSAVLLSFIFFLLDGHIKPTSKIQYSKTC